MAAIPMVCLLEGLTMKKAICLLGFWYFLIQWNPYQRPTVEGPFEHAYECRIALERALTWTDRVSDCYYISGR